MKHMPYTSLVLIQFEMLSVDYDKVITKVEAKVVILLNIIVKLLYKIYMKQLYKKPTCTLASNYERNRNFLLQYFHCNIVVWSFPYYRVFICFVSCLINPEVFSNESLFIFHYPQAPRCLTISTLTRNFDFS